jgi:MGT family glycosyltransferase
MAKSLVDKGHKVDYLTSSKWKTIIDIIGAELIPYADNKKLSIMIKEAFTIARSIGNKYDGMIYDELFFPGRVLGKMLGIPTIRFFPCVAINEQIMRQLLNGRGFMGIFRYAFIRKRWTKEICRALIPDIQDWTDEVVHNAPDCNIVFVPDWFQPDRSDFHADKYHFIGPSIYDDSDTSFLNKLVSLEHPVVYISLGTIENKQLQFYKKCIQIFADKDARFILSVGEKIPIERLGKIPQNCTVIPYAPQKKILEFASLFVTHGGMNSVNEAMVNGVPMLALPVSNDQPINAKRINELGIGKTLNIKKLNETLLWESVSEMLRDKSISIRAKEVKKNLSNAGGETAAIAITSFISHKYKFLRKGR